MQMNNETSSKNSKKNITIRDIAMKTGLSIGSVSRAINGKKGVSEETRAKVIQVIEKEGYHIGNISKNFELQKSHSIAVIIPDITHNFLGKVTLSIKKELKKYNYSVMIFNTNWDVNEERETLLLAQEKKVDGIILKPALDSIDYLRGIHTPTVLVSQIGEGNNSFIDIDNVAAGYIGTKHLLEKGYRHIVFLGSDSPSGMILQRLEGYKKAFHEFGLDVDESLIFQRGDFSLSAGYDLMDELYSKNNMPDSIFCNSDMSALGAFKFASEKNINIPQDMGILGFNNDEITSIPQISLSTISQPYHQIGAMAAQMIVNMIENGSNWTPQTILMLPELIERSTTNRII